MKSSPPYASSESASSPTAHSAAALLAGAITDKSQMGTGDVRAQRYPRFAGDNFDKNLELVRPRHRDFAEGKGVTPASWL